MNSRAASMLLAVLAAGSLALTGCGQPSAPPAAQPGAPGGDAISVVASTNVYGAVASAVGGDRVSVTSIIMSPDADPHEYEATARDAAAVGGAKVLVANGGGYDPFAGKLVEAAATKPVLIDVVAMSGLQPAEAAGEEPADQEQADQEHAGEEPAAGEGHAEEHGAFNEHVWYHLPTMAKLADTLAAELGKAAPADAATFTTNAGAFKARLDELNGKLTAIRAAHPGDRVAVTEPVPGYLVEAAGLVNATPEEFSEAAEEGNDPPAAVLNETLALFGANPVTALLLNPQAENAATRQLQDAAGAAGVPVVTMTETLPAGASDYVSWMGGQIDQLAGALDKR